MPVNIRVLLRSGSGGRDAGRIDRARLARDTPPGTTVSRPRAAASHPDFNRRSRSSTGSASRGCGRVADYNRRFGVSPTPEHASLRQPVCHTRYSREKPDTDTRPPMPVACCGAVTPQAPPIVDYAWRQQSVWSKTADQLKSASLWRWRLRMILTVAAAGLALAGSQLKPVSATASVVLTVVAAVVLAAVGLLRFQQDVEQTRRWTRARSVAEAMKAEVYVFLAQSGGGDTAEREGNLRDRDPPTRSRGRRPPALRAGREPRDACASRGH